jgi:hypothetical protein
MGAVRLEIRAKKEAKKADESKKTSSVGGISRPFRSVPFILLGTTTRLPPSTPPAVPIVSGGPVFKPFFLVVATAIIPAVVPATIIIRVRTSPVIIAPPSIIVPCRPFIFKLPPSGRRPGTTIIFSTTGRRMRPVASVRSPFFTITAVMAIIAVALISITIVLETIIPEAFLSVFATVIAAVIVRVALCKALRNTSAELREKYLRRH